MYLIQFTKTAKKFLKKIPHEDTEVILRKIYLIRESPFRYLKKLQNSKLWRLRILKYRAVVDVVVSRNNIIVLRIGHRKKVYD
jgi:mRNA-degrading endonuclease RelE of RelBE toxin-antitoxin system